MNILIITQCPATGVARYLGSLYSSPSFKECKITIIYSTERSDAVWSKQLDLFTKTPWVRCIAMGQSLKELATFQRRFRALIKDTNIVHLNGAWAGLIGRILISSSTNRKIYYSHHGGSFHQHKSLKYWLAHRVEKLLYCKTDTYLVHSDNEMQLLKAVIREPRHVKKISHGIPNASSGYRRKTLKSTYTFGVVARFIPEKRIGLIVNAFAKFIEKNSTARLIIFGHGPCENELREQIAQLKINDKVEMVKGETNIDKIYSTFNCLINASISEATLLLWAEAYSRKVPVITLKCGPECEYIFQGINGVIVEDAQGLLEAMEEEYRTRGLNKAILNAKLTVFPTWDEVASMYCNEYACMKDKVLNHGIQ